MDELRLNRTTPEPRSSRGSSRFFVIAIALAAGLHIIVLGALALTAHQPKSNLSPAPSRIALTPPVSTPIAATAIRAPAATPAEVAAVPAGTEAAPAPHPWLVAPIPVHKALKPVAHPAHLAPMAHKKPELAPKAKPTSPKTKLEKAKSEWAKPGKIKPDRAKAEKTAPSRTAKAAKTAKHASSAPPARPQAKTQTKAQTKPAPTLDLDALSKFKSSH